jgi:VIT1/CCC1 family predicted Fe2+/Mn2+ transporter
MSRFHKEYHKGERIGWLRAAVLGANDGVISVASLVVGVASAGVAKSAILLTGLSGLIAGMMSMAAGEYVSVKSQADTETAGIATERAEHETQPELELEELTAIYMDRGLDEPLARQVAEHLTDNDAIGAHSRDELGITETLRARPFQASLASALSFAVGAAIPVLAIAVSPQSLVTEVAVISALLSLVLLGGTAAYAGGAPVGRGIMRVTFWGLIAMGFTWLLGRLFGTQV